MAYFVRIDDPKRFRLDILEDSKQVIGSLQAVRSVLYVRQQKRQLLDQLVDQVKELGMLMTELDKRLPEKQLRQEAIDQEREDAEALKKKSSSRPSSKKKSSPKKKAVKPVEKKPVGEEEQLAAALTRIEEKLSHLK